MLATVTCWLDCGNPLSEDHRKESPTTQNRMRLDLNLPSLSDLPLPVSSVLSTFPAFLCPETILHHPGSWGEPPILLPCTST